jgi:NADPH-dependent curcumin reductase CurA
MTERPSMTRAREIHLAARPTGEPTPENFALVETELPQPGPGQVLVRNVVMSVDPYMRGRMNDAKSYVPPFQVGAALDGGAIGTVVASSVDALKPGDLVLHGLGWRDYALLDAKHVRQVDPAVGPSAHLGVLGMPGLTAYVGLLDIAAMKPGDTVFVSGAAGAVGSLAGQIARLRGASRVIGSAGSASKVEYLVDQLGFDAAFNYKDAPVRRQLREAAPDGIDVYFDNVGGSHLEAAITAFKPYGRAALCGAISQYNATDTSAPNNLALAIGKRLTMRGFIVSDHNDRMPAFQNEVAGWLADGDIAFAETFVDGLENAPAALIGMLRGDNTGKMIVRL